MKVHLCNELIFCIVRLTLENCSVNPTGLKIFEKNLGVTIFRI